MTIPGLRIDYPTWVHEHVDWAARYATRDERVGLAIELARQNVLNETGGPFGAAVFEAGTGELVAAGMNLVVPLGNSVLHAEVVAIMMAEARIGSYTLGGPDLPAYELTTSAEPCAMCLGAVLWSGVRRVVTAATRADVMTRLLFDEGPVFPESWQYLADRGVEVVREVRRQDAYEVLDLYARMGGAVYNG